jgi:hypothetical protein
MAPDVATKDDLLKRIGAEERKWTITTAGWLLVYAVFLVVVVVFPIIIASKEGFSKSVLGDIGPYVPILAFAVAAVAALDQKLQSQNRWHWYGDDRDAARELILEVQDTPAHDAARLEACRESWRALVKTHNGHRV